jgi:hypothetical protein
LYNFHALTRTHGILNVELTPDQLTDKLSPANSPWRVSRLDEYRVLGQYAYQTTEFPPLPPDGLRGKLSGYTLEDYPDTDPKGHATNITGFTALGNVSRSNTATGTNGGTFFLCLDSYQYRGTRTIAFEQHWMTFFNVNTTLKAEAGHGPMLPGGQSCHRGKYVRLILDL